MMDQLLAMLYGYPLKNQKFLQLVTDIFEPLKGIITCYAHF